MQTIQFQIKKLRDDAEMPCNLQNGTFRIAGFKESDFVYRTGLHVTMPEKYCLEIKTHNIDIIGKIMYDDGEIIFKPEYTGWHDTMYAIVEPRKKMDFEFILKD